MSDDFSLDDILNGATFDEEVKASGGSTIKFEVGDSLIGVLKSTFEKASDLNPDRMQTGYNFTLAAPGTFSQGPQADTKRVDFEAGTEVTLYGKGNLPYVMKSVAVGEIVKVQRNKDEKMEGRPRGKDMTSAWSVFRPRKG